MTTVRFVDFWKDFDPNDNIFVKILRENMENISIRSQRKFPVDIELSSVELNRGAQIARKIATFTKKTSFTEPALLNVRQSYNLKSKNFAAKKIWYTPENVRPPLMSDFDGYLSFDQDDFNGINAYLPLWWLRLNWYEKAHYSPQLGTTVSKENLLQQRELRSKKTKFACAFIGNPHPVRMHFIRRLSDLGIVDIFGKSVGRPVENKFNIAKDYKFNICFENDIYPGYVTEKLIDAYVTENIPIYWGSLGNDQLINKSSFLNLSDYDSVTDFIDHLSQVDYEYLYHQKFLNSLPDLSEVIKVICGENY